jgi:hypothetical protein
MGLLASARQVVRDPDDVRTLSTINGLCCQLYIKVIDIAKTRLKAFDAKWLVSQRRTEAANIKLLIDSADQLLCKLPLDKKPGGAEGRITKLWTELQPKIPPAPVIPNGGLR